MTQAIRTVSRIEELDDATSVANVVNHGATDLTVAQALEYAAGGVYNVMAYGAIGNGIADDTAAIQAALDAAHSAGRGTVVFSAGKTHLVNAKTGGCSVYSNTRVIGNGALMHLKLAISETGSYQIFAIPDGEHDIEIAGFEFFGDNDPFDGLYANIEQNVISMPGTSGITKDVWIHHCTFRNIWGFTVHNAGTGYRINITDCTMRECGNGLNVNSDYTIQARNQFYKCEGIETSGAYAVIVDNLIVSGPTGISLGGRTTPGADTPGVRCANNIIADTVSGPAISVNDSCQDTVIDGNIIIRPYTFGVLVVAGGHNKVLNTRISNNTIRSPGNDGAALGLRCGIYVAPTVTANDVDGVSISGNYIYANAEDADYSPAYGILVAETTTVDIAENVIAGMSDKDIGCNTVLNLTFGRNRCDPAKVEFIDNTAFTTDLYPAPVRTAIGPWYQDDVAADQSAVVLNLDGNLRAEIPMVAPGSVVGVAVYSNAGRSAGTLTVDVTINGTATGLQAVLNGTSVQAKQTTQDIIADVFVAGDRIGVKITTDSSWAPTTADITVSVLVVLR